jgi:hypothetical protein
VAGPERAGIPSQENRHEPGPQSPRVLWGSAVAAGAAALGLAETDRLAAAPKSPSLPVSIARCKAYDFKEVLEQVRVMMDQLGGLRPLVAGKTVCLKVNLTGNPRQKVLDLPASRTYHTHPHVVRAAATLLDQAGARRIRIVETTYQKGPLEGLLRDAGWDLQALSALSAKVEYEDTRNKGRGQRYHEVKVPWGGSLYPAYLLFHRFSKCTADAATGRRTFTSSSHSASASPPFAYPSVAPRPRPPLHDSRLATAPQASPPPRRPPLRLLGSDSFTARPPSSAASRGRLRRQPRNHGRSPACGRSACSGASRRRTTRTARPGAGRTTGRRESSPRTALRPAAAGRRGSRRGSRGR